MHHLVTCLITDTVSTSSVDIFIMGSSHDPSQPRQGIHLTLPRHGLNRVYIRKGQKPIQFRARQSLTLTAVLSPAVVLDCIIILNLAVVLTLTTVLGPVVVLDCVVVLDPMAVLDPVAVLIIILSPVAILIVNLILLMAGLILAAIC